MLALGKFSGKLLLSAAAVHVVVSASAALDTSRSFQRRMPNVRVLDSEPRAKQRFIASYLAEAVDYGRPATRFVGSSLTWDYPMREGAALTAAAGEVIGDSRTILASIIGAGPARTGKRLGIARSCRGGSRP
jgi:hypothetical protein